MQEESCADAQADSIVEWQPAIEQEDQVEEEKGHAELDQDLGWNIPEKFSAKEQLIEITFIHLNDN